MDTLKYKDILYMDTLKYKDIVKIDTLKYKDIMKLQVVIFELWPFVPIFIIFKTSQCRDNTEFMSPSL